MKARFAVLSCSFFLPLSSSHKPTPRIPRPQGQKELTIEDIFKPGGILGRGPENVKWSPDGTKVSFVQRDDTGEHGELYYVDVATGKSAVLVASGKLAALAPPDQLHQGRAQEGSGHTLFHRGLSLGARLQAPAVRLHGPALAL